MTHPKIEKLFRHVANSGRSVEDVRPGQRFYEDDSRNKRNYLKHYSDNGTKKRNLTKSKIDRELRKIKPILKQKNLSWTKIGSDIILVATTGNTFCIIQN